MLMRRSRRKSGSSSRVGINLGDVIAASEDIFGDGVNVVARLEAIAEAGGICVSRVG
jgi:adenylate cyclase